MFAAIVLAAGKSRRMRRNKLRLPFGAVTVVEAVVREIRAAVGDVVVVTGYEREAIEAMPFGRAVRFAFNEDYIEGEMLSSVQVGLRAMRSDCQAALIAQADQPHVPTETIERILKAHRPGCIVIPSYRRRRGHPILLDRVFWPAVLALPLDATLRTVIHAHAENIVHVAVDTNTVLDDLDTQEDYERAVSRLRGKQKHRR